METRTVIEIKIWKVLLNRMTGRAEEVDIAVMSTDRQKIEDYYNSKKVDIYEDGRFNKNFKKGSLLEWFNDTRWNRNSPFEEEWVDESFFYGELQEDERFMEGNKFVNVLESEQNE